MEAVGVNELWGYMEVSIRRVDTFSLPRSFESSDLGSCDGLLSQLRREGLVWLIKGQEPGQCV